MKFTGIAHPYLQASNILRSPDNKPYKVAMQANLYVWGGVSQHS